MIGFFRGGGCITDTYESSRAQVGYIQCNSIQSYMFVCIFPPFNLELSGHPYHAHHKFVGSRLDK
jgi:hypothetical protein